MEELTLRLNNVKDSYRDFVLGITEYARKKPERIEAVMRFLDDQPDAGASDIVYFVSTQPDFLEDTVLMRVG